MKTQKTSQTLTVFLTQTYVFVKELGGPLLALRSRA